LLVIEFPPFKCELSSDRFTGIPSTSHENRGS
jgi:hypothetical protein